MDTILGKIVTTDGYTFYHLEGGRVADDHNPDAMDMSWDTLKEFADSMGGDHTVLANEFWTYYPVR